jgi:glycosyltransferase involved in cell wall biosynthesis
MSADVINIMYVIGSMGTARAGTERNLLTIIEHLDPVQFKPCLVSLQDCEYTRKGEYLCDTECLHVHRMFTPKMFRARRALADRMRELRISVVQTFFVEAHLVGGAAARMADVPVVISSRRNLGYSYSAKEKLFLKSANRYPGRWLANCKAVASRIAELEGLDERCFDVIYNGVPLLERSRGSESPQRFDVVMAANLRPIKAVDVLIRAAATVIAERPETSFAVLGEGPLQQKLEILTGELRLEHAVTFAGSQSDIAPWLRNAKIGVLTSQSEGCSNAILEYMNASLPVAATPVGGNPELIVDGKTGYLVAVSDPQVLAEKLLDLLGNPEKAERMGEAGRRRVEQMFSLERMISQHQEYYQRLLTDHSR